MKKSIAAILTILLAASTFTACSQADGALQLSGVRQAETSVTEAAATEKPTQKPTDSTETVTAETSPVSDETQPSTTEPSKTEKPATSRNSGDVGQNSESDGEQSESPHQSQNEAPKQQSKTDTQTENKPKSTEAPKAAEKPKAEEKPKATEAPKPKATEKPAEKPKKQSIDFGRVTSTLISYGCSLGMVYNSSLNTGNAGWFPPLDVSGYSDTESVISAGYDEVGYLPYYFGSSAEPGDIAFNVIASNNQIYVVYG